jgi:hypothetical protein
MLLRWLNTERLRQEKQVADEMKITTGFNFVANSRPKIRLGRPWRGRKELLKCIFLRVDWLKAGSRGEFCDVSIAEGMKASQIRTT